MRPRAMQMRGSRARTAGPGRQLCPHTNPVLRRRTASPLLGRRLQSALTVCGPVSTVAAHLFRRKPMWLTHQPTSSVYLQPSLPASSSRLNGRFSHTPERSSPGRFMSTFGPPTVSHSRPAHVATSASARLRPTTVSFFRRRIEAKADLRPAITPTANRADHPTVHAPTNPARHRGVFGAQFDFDDNYYSRFSSSCHDLCAPHGLETSLTDRASCLSPSQACRGFAVHQTPYAATTNARGLRNHPQNRLQGRPAAPAGCACIAAITLMTRLCARNYRTSLPSFRPDTANPGEDLASALCTPFLAIGQRVFLDSNPPTYGAVPKTTGELVSARGELQPRLLHRRNAVVSLHATQHCSSHHFDASGRQHLWQCLDWQMASVFVPKPKGSPRRVVHPETVFTEINRVLPSAARRAPIYSTPGQSTPPRAAVLMRACPRHRRLRPPWCRPVTIIQQHRP